jgi:exodeoxyribonuclease-3
MPGLLTPRPPSSFSHWQLHIRARTIQPPFCESETGQPRPSLAYPRPPPTRAIIKHPLPMKIATYNVNSIRRRLPIVLDWIAEHTPDVMCLQETKVQDHEFPIDAIRDAGYHASFRGMKAYNGVATLTRTPPEKVIHGLHEGEDSEDFRIIQTVVSGVPIINAYVPQGNSIASEKYALKLAWFRRLRAYFESALNPDQPAIWVGDLNVAPEPIDVYHPEKRVNDPDFHIDARNAYKEVVVWGFVDAFRKLHPDVVQCLRAELRLAHRPYNGDGRDGCALPHRRSRHGSA